MLSEEARTLLARLSENHRQAYTLIDDAQAALWRLSEVLDPKTRATDEEALLGDLRAIAQRAAALLAGRRELLGELEKLGRTVGEL